MVAPTYAYRITAVLLSCCFLAVHSSNLSGQATSTEQVAAEVSFAEVATSELAPETKGFQAGNILVSTRTLLYEFDVEGNKIQEFNFPTRLYENDNTYLENMHGESVGCDSDGVAWMLMEATRVEVEAEKFVEWAYPCMCFATLDSKNGTFRIQYLPEMPERAKSSRHVLVANDEIILKTRETVSFRINKDTFEVKSELLSANTPPFDFSVHALDDNGNRYQYEKGKLLFETKEKTHTFNLKRDFDIRYLKDLEVHPSGLLIMSSVSSHELLVAQPDPQKGTVEILKKVELKDQGYICVVPKQSD